MTNEAHINTRQSIRIRTEVDPRIHEVAHLKRVRVVAVGVQAPISAWKDSGLVMIALSSNAFIGHQRLPGVVYPQAAPSLLVYARDCAVQQAD